MTELDLSADRSRNGMLVHEASSSGRWVSLVTYLEGGTRPVESRIICHSAEKAAALAKLLAEARDP